MLIRTLTALTVFAALPLGAALAQPAVPAVAPRPGAVVAPPARPAAPPAPVSADAPPTSDPTGPVPLASAPAPAARPTAPVRADDPPTTDTAPVTTAAPAFAPRPAPIATSAADAPPTTDAAPVTTPAFAPAPAARNPNAAVPAVSPSATPAPPAPIDNSAPTTDAAAATTPIPTEQALQTVPKNSPLTPEGNASFLAAYAAMPDVKTLTGGTLYRVLVTGKGTISPISRMDTVTVSYRGWLINGTSFDNSPVGNPRSFQLNGLIPGWREALLKMKVGDLWEIVVPAAQAYGEEGRDGRIPPNQTLVFVVSLAKIEYAG